MATIAEIRQQYPDYADLSDDQLASALHQKFYSDMPRDAFNQKIGLAATPTTLKAGINPTVDPVMDVVKSVPTGAAESTLNLLSLPQFAVKLGRQIHDRITSGGNASFADRFNPPDEPPWMKMPMAGEMAQKAIESKTGEFYQPQTEEGQYAKRFGGFLPNVIGGPGGVTSRVVTQAVAPFVASEAAGKLTEGTKAEPVARALAALAAGPAAARVAGGAPVATANQLKGAYREVVNDPVLRSTPVNTAGMSGRVENALNARGFDPLNAPIPYQRAQHIDTYQAPTVSDILAVRQKLSADERAARSNQITGAPEAASRTAKKSVDQELNAIDPRFADANVNYAVAKGSEYLTGKRDLALLRAGAANSGQNIGNAQRQRLVDILASPRARGNFTQSQRDQIEKIAEGSWASNTARAWANRLGGGGGALQTLIASGALGGGGYYAGGPEGAAGGIALALAGRGMKGVENALVSRQVNALDRSIRRGAPYKVPPIDINNPDVVRALLAGNAATQEFR